MLNEIMVQCFFICNSTLTVIYRESYQGMRLDPREKLVIPLRNRTYMYGLIFQMLQTQRNTNNPNTNPNLVYTYMGERYQYR